MATAADQGCESPWDIGQHAYHGGDTEQVSWQGMYLITKNRKRKQFTKRTGFDEGIHLSARIGSMPSQ